MGRTVSSDPNVIPLAASATGYNAGDYIYETNAGFGSIPTGALTSGNFPAGSTSFLAYAQTAATVNEFTYVEQLGGSFGSQVAAQLVNGNIVYVYATGGTASFRIETGAGVVVVAETSAAMNVSGNAAWVSVVALPAGGFCIVCGGTDSFPNFQFVARFYNADGTAATAVLAGPSGIATSTITSRLKLQAQSTGAVVIGYINGATNGFELRRVTTAGFDGSFGSSGVSAIATFGVTSTWWDFVVDSVNDIHVVFLVSGGTLTMRRLNSSGVQQTTSSVTITTPYSVSVAISSTGVIRGFCQDASGVVVVTWNGSVAAVGTRIISSTTTANNAAFGVFAQGASGGYVVFYSDIVAGTATPCLYLQAFSSSDVALATRTRVNGAIAIDYRTQFVPIVVSGNTRVHFGIYQQNNNNTNTGTSFRIPMGIAYFAYSNTTFALVGGGSTTIPSLPVGPFALGTYARQGSTPHEARFNIASTGNYTTNYTTGTLIAQKTLIDAVSTSRVSLAPLPNGEFVAVWGRSTGGTFISRYSAAGTLIAGPVTVSTLGGSSAPLGAGVAVFANGNIFVTHFAGGNTLGFVIYTPALAVVTSGTVSTDFAPIVNVPVAVSSFGIGNHIAVGFRRNFNSVQYFVSLVRDTGAVAGFNPVVSTSPGSAVLGQIVPFKSGGFAAVATGNAADGGSQTGVLIIRQTGAATFQQTSSGTVFTGASGQAGFVTGSTPAPASGTTAYAITALGGSGAYVYFIASVNPRFGDGAQLNGFQFSEGVFAASVDSSSALTIGYTASGLPVAVTNGTASRFISVQPLNANTSGQNLVSTGVFTTALATQAAQNGVSVIPHIGDAVWIGYIDNLGLPSFVSVVVAPFSVTTPLTVGVDASATALSLTPNSGYILKGVALTGASAGGTGLVQTLGAATLSSSYSASTPATSFDFTNPISSGAKGVVVGRSVTIQG